MLYPRRHSSSMLALALACVLALVSLSASVMRLTNIISCI